MRKKIVAANWKLNGGIAFARDFLAKLDVPAGGVEVVIFPPFPLLAEVISQSERKRVSVGAQTASRWASGAYTGEVSAGMLAELGCRYVLVGHSERRQYFGETNEVVAEILCRVLESGLVPVLCVGETLAEREAGLTERVIGSQLHSCLLRLEEMPASSYPLVVAYEPVWAIGTGLTATPEQAQAVHAFIRAELLKGKKVDGNAVTVLYGGSVKADNARALFSMPDIDGGLVGGASLSPDDFAQIAWSAV